LFIVKVGKFVQFAIGCRFLELGHLMGRQVVEGLKVGTISEVASGGVFVCVAERFLGFSIAFGKKVEG